MSDDKRQQGNSSINTNTRLVLSMSSPLLSTIEEEGLFRRLATARRVENSLASKRKRSPTEQSQLGAARKQIMVIRERIVTANLPIVVKLAQRMRCPGVSGDEFVSEGLLKLLQCVDGFDETRGFKFSTYLYRSLLRMFYRYAKNYQHRNSGRIEDEDSYFQNAPVEDEESAEVIDLRDVLDKNRADLSEIEMFLVRHSYGIGEEPKTLHEIHVLIGAKLSGGRLQQILAGAIEKLAAVLVRGERE